MQWPSPRTLSSIAQQTTTSTYGWSLSLEEPRDQGNIKQSREQKSQWTEQFSMYVERRRYPSVPDYRTHWRESKPARGQTIRGQKNNSHLQRGCSVPFTGSCTQINLVRHETVQGGDYPDDLYVADELIKAQKRLHGELHCELNLKGYAGFDMSGEREPFYKGTKKVVWPLLV